MLTLRFASSRRCPKGQVLRWFSGKGDDWRGGDNGDSSSSIFDDVEIDAPAKREEPPAPRRSALFTTAPKKREPVIEGTPKISVSQALYLAKEAGIFTTRELQTHVIKSPSFSTDTEAPFLLETFFTDSEPPAARIAPKQESAVEQQTKTDTENTDILSGQDVVPATVQTFFQNLAAEPPVESFVARGREWLVTGQGRGTRKRAVAHVLLQKGTGIVTVNGKEDFYKRWPLLSNRFDVLFPFEATQAAGLFDVSIAVKGGGISGQAGAARLAVGRALVAVNPQCADDLKDTLVLSEDTRQKTSKFPGKKGAYARRNWTLR